MSTLRDEVAPLHLVLGDCAAALLRLAVSKHGLPGEVRCIPDDLSHGPLDSGMRRIAYMRACCAGYLEWQHTETDAFAPWRTIADELELRPRTVIVWAGSNASEGTLLAMACWWLREIAAPLARIPVSWNGYSSHTGSLRPEMLAALYPRCRRFSTLKALTLSRKFEQLRNEGALLRRWQSGVVSAPLSAFDDRLLACLQHTWRSAVQVIGDAVGRGRREPMSDVFYASRLQALIAQGRIEVDHSERRLRESRVRLTCSHEGAV